ncbi:hypothetical protein HDV64DRAFT_240749 [Trichoderma sp. TUCIM 5745]
MLKRRRLTGMFLQMVCRANKVCSGFIHSWHSNLILAVASHITVVIKLAMGTLYRDQHILCYVSGFLAALYSVLLVLGSLLALIGSTALLLRSSCRFV